MRKNFKLFFFALNTDTKGTYPTVRIERVFVERGFTVIYVFFSM